MKKLLVLILAATFCGWLDAKDYKLWYTSPAPDGGAVMPAGESDRPLDYGWENYSLPIGNGFMGASVFGGIKSERLQITDKTLYIKGLWRAQTNTSFMDLYLDFFHPYYTDYHRELSLNESMARVSYDYDGVTYLREYFMSYPDRALVMKISAGKPGKLTFTVRPEIPYLTPYGPLQRTDSITKGYLSGHTQTRHSYNGRKGQVTATDNRILITGATEYLGIQYEAQLQVLLTGGSLTAHNDSHNDHGTLHVEDADEAVIILTLGTNYRMHQQTFMNPPKEKLKGFPNPHHEVTEQLDAAVRMGYERLRERHLTDFKSYFDRVRIDLGEPEVNLPTDSLLAEYKSGKRHAYLEELFFQYGRYLLVSSTRKGALPPTLQGVWNQYELAPWNGNYTHNINIQMNYWPCFNTNLIDLFETYADYYNAYLPEAERAATEFIRIHHPERCSDAPKGNGWTMGVGACPYHVGMPGGHSGPGTSAFTSKLFWDYYEFTRSRKVLEELAYPAVLGTANFLSKTVQDTLGCLLAYPSSSPEQYNKKTRKPMPTVGCAFDQEMIYENHRDAIRGNRILGKSKKEVSLFEQQVKRLDPIHIGASGQIKEYREEKYYGDLVLEQNHRHISHLVGLYPGTQINENTPVWMDAAQVTLNRRGDRSTGWSMAHKLNLWARTKNGDRAYQILNTLFDSAVLNNLWTTCLAVLRSPFQIDANFGTTAGIAEMLLQSHEGYIAPLPALPGKWRNGAYAGLTARGNFEVSISWHDGHIKQMEVLSKGGQRCTVRYPNIAAARVVDAQGKPVKYKAMGKNQLSFATVEGGRYLFSDIPACRILPAPGGMELTSGTSRSLTLSWDKTDGAVSYTIYRSVGNEPVYRLVTDGLTERTYTYALADKEPGDCILWKVVAVDAEGREGKGMVKVWENRSR